VMKSGATTGLTFSHIVSSTGELKDEKLKVTLEGAFLIDNYCPDNPDLPATKYGDPAKDPDLKPTQAKNLFGWKGDSGSLIVVGNPDGMLAVKGTEVHYELYNQSDKDKRQRAYDKYYKAALGLLCAVTQEVRPGGGVRYPYVIGQRIQLAMDALDFKLDCGT